ncbi:hypothetical protein [uncultured Roseovarius sp.]|uniref:hypothetical protein n=1 Tax=uncultured Roseovarius sp. TaxID=293344 RepID=UPI00262D2695|nr:hypothetical protein [uncultured Roseovarius sp.]
MSDQNTVVAPLEERLQMLEQPENQGVGFSGLSWALLALTGIVAPALILIWGAS